MTNRLTFALIGALATQACFAQSMPYVSWLIDPGESSSAKIEVWPAPTPIKNYVWRLLSSDGVILAEMPQPDIPSGYTVNYGECNIDGVLRHNVIAIVRHTEKREWSKDVLSMWLANAEAKSFAKGSTHQATCRNERYGV